MGKPLITFWEGNSKRLKLEKSQTLPVPFLSVGLHTGEGPERGYLTAEWEPCTKTLVVLWTLKLRGGEWVRSRCRKILGTESEWRKVSSRFPHPAPPLLA